MTILSFGPVAALRGVDHPPLSFSNVSSGGTGLAAAVAANAAGVTANTSDLAAEIASTDAEQLAQDAAIAAS